MNTWIIIPAHNERKHIADVVARCARTGISNIIVVDDGSADTTSDEAARAGAIVLRHIVNLGKGAAMKTGADFALTQNADAIIFLDGDGQHDPAEIPRFLAALRRGKGIVFGARRVRKQMPLERKLGSALLRSMIGIVYNVRIHDPLSGYRALTAAAYRKVRWKSRDYGVESEMIARAGKAAIEYDEVEISTIYHDRYKGMTALDGIKIVLRLLWWRMTH